jgi:ribosomal protein S18 acetylase RimI-like enzyme
MAVAETTELIRIVDAGESDIEGLIEIYSSPHLYQNRREASWLVWSFFEYHHIKIIKHEEKIVGALLWSVMDQIQHGVTAIYDFWIDEGFRRRGLGGRLIQAVIEDMKHLLASNSFVLRKVLLTTSDNNVPAIRLYEKVGFQRSAAFADLFAQGATEIAYVLTLSP